MMDVQKNITIFGEEIQKNVGCEYGHFRMQVFITGLIGTGMVTKGPHLRQLSFPAKGTAPYNHLTIPNIGVIPDEQVNEVATSRHPRDTIPEESFDDAMELISSNLKLPHYFRDAIEDGCCESVNRGDLQKVEVHVKGGDTFDIDRNGMAIYKKYGVLEGGWEPVPNGTFEMAFLGRDTTQIVEDPNHEYS